MISVSIMCSTKDESEFLKMLVNRIPFFYLVNTYDKDETGFEFASKTQVDLLIINGRYARLLSGNKLAAHQLSKAIIVFSNTPEDAVIAYDCNCIDFLIWPISFERFMAAVLKVQNYLKLTALRKEFPEAIPGHGEKEILFLRTGTAIQKINVNDITFFEKEGNYFHVHTTTAKTLLIRINFEKLISLLPGNQFLRVHKSFIVSLYHIDKIESDEIIIGTNKIPISISYKDVFLDLIKKKYRYMNYPFQKITKNPAA